MQISNLLLVACASAALLVATLANAADNQAQAKARQAVRAKMDEPLSQQSTAPAPKVAAPVVVPAAAPLVSRVQPADSQAIERARAATREKIQNMDSSAAPVALPSPADEAALNKAREAMRNRAAQIQPQPSLKLGELPPLEKTPSSLVSEKQQKLTELLQRYRADEITPEDYHRERMKILSEP